MIKKFLEYLEIEKRYAKPTLLAYRTDLLQFSTYCSSEFEISPEAGNYQIVRAWIIHLMNEGISNRSVNRKLSGLRSFFKFLLKVDFRKDNPMSKIVPPKSSKNLPVFVEEAKMNSLLDGANFLDNYFGKRDKLILNMFYQTGMRLSELIHIKISDISDSSVKVLGKRDKERLIPLSLNLQQDINDFIEYRTIYLSKNEPFLFLTNSGKKMYQKFVYRLVNKYLGNVTSLSKRSPHVLRHTFATHMLNNGASIEAIKEILGHANLTATQVYTHNSINKLKRVHALAHPRGA